MSRSWKGRGLALKLARDANYVKRIVTWPCAIPIEIWVETFGPALLRLFWSAGPWDKKWLFHHVFGHSWLCGLKQRLLAVEEATRVPIPGAMKTIFRVAAILDTLAWVFFVASVSLEFVSTWHTMARKARHCGTTGFAQHYGAGIGAVGGDGTFLWNGSGGFVRGQVGLTTFRGVRVPAGVPCTVGGHVSGKPGLFSVGSMTIQTSLYDYTNAEHIEHGDPLPVGADPTNYGVHWSHVHPDVDHEIGPVFTLVGPPTATFDVTDGICMIQIET
jgi:hypothetical protein